MLSIKDVNILYLSVLTYIFGAQKNHLIDILHKL